MPYQLDMTRHNMRPNWVGPTTLIMKIALSLRSPDPEYLRKHNYNNLRELRCDLTRDELWLPSPRSAWSIRNWDKEIMTYIRSY